jgi:hypothetical protein
MDLFDIDVFTVGYGPRRRRGDASFYGRPALTKSFAGNSPLLQEIKWSCEELHRQCKV